MNGLGQNAGLTVASIFAGAIDQIRKAPAICIGAFVVIMVTDSLIEFGTQVFTSIAENERGLLAELVAGSRAELVIIYFLFYFLVTAAVIIALMQRENLIWRHRTAGVALFYSVITYSIASIGQIIGLVFLILPGLYLIARWYIAVPIIIGRGMRIIEGLGKSWDVTRSSAGAIMGFVLVTIIPSILLAIVGISASAGGQFIELIISAMSVLVDSVFAIISIASAVFVYRKLIDDRQEIQEVFA